MMLEDEYKIQLLCDECDAYVREEHKYCHNCGNFLAAENATINIFNNVHLRRIFFFYFLYLFICLFVKYSSKLRSYDQLFWVEIILAAVTLRFAWLNKDEMKPVFKFNNFKWYLLAGIIVLAGACSFVISYSVREVNVTFFHTDISYYNAFRLYIYPTLIMIYSIAIMPAVFEEVAFRGVMYNYCTAFLDERLVVIITAFLFAIMHLSLISLVWLIPFGILLGNLRRKYNTIWYGVAFHFTFNFTACLLDLYRQGELF